MNFNQVLIRCLFVVRWVSLMAVLVLCGGVAYAQEPYIYYIEYPCIGQEQTFTIISEEYPCRAVEWEIEGGIKNVDYQRREPNNTTLSIQFLPLSHGRVYTIRARLMCQDGNNPFGESETYVAPVVVTVYAKPDTPVITATNLVVCPGDEVILDAGVGADSFEWYASNAQANQELEGQTGKQVVVHPTQTTTYQVQAHSPGKNCSSDAIAEITISVKIVEPSLRGIIKVTESRIIQPGLNYGKLLLTAYQGMIGSWEKSEDGGKTWVAMGNEGKDSYRFENLLNDTYFRVALVGSNGCKKYVVSVLIRVRDYNWIESRTFNKTIETRVVSGGSDADPKTFYSEQIIQLPVPLVITSESEKNRYVSTQEIVIPAGGKVGVAAGGEVTLEVRSLQLYETKPRDEYVVSEGRAYFDDAGNPMQTLSRVMSSKAPDEPTAQAEMMASVPLYGKYHTAVGQTLAAPVGNGGFGYVPNFITAGGVPYDYTHFDQKDLTADRINNPVAVDEDSPLGKYYSNQNDREPYVATTSYPYSRSEAYEDGSGEMKRSGGVGDELRMGNGHDSYGATFPVANELDHYLQIRKLFLPDAAQPITMAGVAVKQVGIDVNGKEAVSFADKSGKAIAACLSGAGLTAQTVHTAASLSLPLYWVNLDFPFVIEYPIIGIRTQGAEPIQIIDRSTGEVLYQDAKGEVRFQLGQGLQPIQLQVRSTGSFQLSASCEGFNNGQWESYPVQAPAATATARLHLPDAKGSHLLTMSTLDESLPVGVVVRAENLLTEQVAFQQGLSAGAAASKTMSGGFYSLTLCRSDGKPLTLSDIAYQNSYTSASVQLKYAYPTENWTYSFYNEVGQLVASIAPEGVRAIWGKTIGANQEISSVAQIPFVTRYEYNLQGQLVSQTETDAGKSQYVYRKDGQIRFSQNALQEAKSRFSYTNYDGYGRPVESGEFVPAAGSGIAFAVTGMNESLIESTAADGGLTSGTKQDWTRTYYSVAPWAVPQEWSSYVADYTQAAVAASENSHARTWYSYDEQGRVAWMLQDIVGLGSKMVEYAYDLLGNVLTVSYQKGKSDAFYHYYGYDDDLRLKTVYTSKDGQQRDLQATYYYYLHGPLKRVELADKLQGIDYVYTIQGWLKSINHPDKANDPGKDTDDAFGMQLDYFSGDYTRTGSQIGFTTSPQAAAAQYHGGTITGQHWRSEGTLVGTQTGAYTYSYDPRYQLRETQFGSVSGGVFTPNGTVYKESNLTYDWNGNIQSLKRYDATVAANQNTVVEPIHNFTYQYLQKNNLPTNQLASIPNYGSYQYDQLGQLEHEQLVGKPDRYYSYEVSGKVSGLYADANRTQPKVQFGYDAIGQRLYKYSSESQLTTYYVRDASGNVLAIYEKTGNTNPIQQEIPIYGSGRLGTLNVLARSYVYELRDHLGNVRVVVGKVNGSLDIFSQSDYYALGSVLRRRGDYRYGYQGMYAEEDKETGKNSFELRMYDAVIGRWLTTDPAREFPSPYVAMGNNWVSVTDPDGGCTTCPQGKEAAAVYSPGATVTNADGSWTWTGSAWTDNAMTESVNLYTAKSKADYRASSRFFLGYPDWVIQRGATQGYDKYWQFNWGKNGMPSHPSARGNVEFDNTLAMMFMPVPKFFRAGGVAAEGTSTALVPMTEEIFSQAAAAESMGVVEKIGGYSIWGTKGLAGNVFNRNIFLITASHKSMSGFRSLVTTLETEAMQSGAHRISIYGSSIVNQGFLNPNIAARFGYSFEAVGEGAFLQKTLIP